MQTTGNTIFIPGATSGIGLALAQRLHAAGNVVIVGGRRRELLDRIVAEHDGMAAVAVDVADPASIEAARDELLRTHPELNVVVAMAGIMVPEDLHGPGFLETSEATIATNLLGTIRTIAAFVPHLTARPDGVLMTVSSGLAFVPLAMTPTYNATKAAVHSFTQSLRVQLSDTPLQVIELVPPAVDTDLMAGDFGGMPLDAFADEVMELLAAHPDADEVLVENVHPLRFAEARGTHAQMVAALSGH
ncbi:SDR family oxidoreductase [Patulibacter americanus]|uniref:SDR family oxidoreductase n=1 Tax=Patulibacter americanus TaxID=588672 RepID=UPI0003B6993E|nr:SDR family NAD(P)-dependent oxidoreductase [Patulibacter americanus]